MGRLINVLNEKEKVINDRILAAEEIFKEDIKFYEEELSKLQKEIEKLKEEIRILHTQKPMTIEQGKAEMKKFLKEAEIGKPFDYGTKTTY